MANISIKYKFENFVNKLEYNAKKIAMSEVNERGDSNHKIALITGITGQVSTYFYCMYSFKLVPLENIVGFV